MARLKVAVLANMKKNAPKIPGIPEDYWADLDPVETVDGLVDALRQFEGTLVFISHDVHFIRALANKVEELARYRSEFFGKLREALAGQRDVQVVGDRFVFQSEVLFPSGSAQLQPAGWP